MSDSRLGVCKTFQLHKIVTSTSVNDKFYLKKPLLYLFGRNHLSAARRSQLLLSLLLCRPPCLQFAGFLTEILLPCDGHVVVQCCPRRHRHRIDTYFVNEEPLYQEPTISLWNLHVEAKIFNELILLKEKSLRSFLI